MKRGDTLAAQCAIARAGRAAIAAALDQLGVALPEEADQGLVATENGDDLVARALQIEALLELHVTCSFLAQVGLRNVGYCSGFPEFHCVERPPVRVFRPIDAASANLAL